MNIRLRQYPPNYLEICNHIPAVRKHKNIVFTYGDTVYVPSGATIEPDLAIHEAVHVQQQSKPVEWWDRYLTDVQFRLDQEVEAYQAQYKYIRRFYNRDKRRKIIKTIASDLSGEMYGKIITKEEAIEKITSRWI
jgi:hypothetical protein